MTTAWYSEWTTHVLPGLATTTFLVAGVLAGLSLLVFWAKTAGKQ